MKSSLCLPDKNCLNGLRSRFALLSILLLSGSSLNGSIIEWKFSGLVNSESSERADSPGFSDSDFVAGDSYIFIAHFDTSGASSGGNWGLEPYFINSVFSLETSSGLLIERSDPTADSFMRRAYFGPGRTRFDMYFLQDSLSLEAGEIGDRELRSIGISGISPDYASSGPHVPLTPEEYLLTSIPQAINISFFDEDLPEPSFDGLTFQVTSHSVRHVPETGGTLGLLAISLFAGSFLRLVSKIHLLIRPL